LKLEDDPTLEVSIKEATASSDLCTNQIGPFKAEGQDSSAATREDKEISSTNNVGQASVPKVEDKEGHHLTLPMHPGGWPTSPSQWIWTMPTPPTGTGMGKAKDADNSDLTQLPPDPLEAQPTMPVLNVGKRDISPKTVHATAKDTLG